MKNNTICRDLYAFFENAIRKPSEATQPDPEILRSIQNSSTNIFDIDEIVSSKEKSPIRRLSRENSADPIEDCFESLNERPALNGKECSCSHDSLLRENKDLKEENARLVNKLLKMNKLFDEFSLQRFKNLDLNKMIHIRKIKIKAIHKIEKKHCFVR